MSNLPQPPEGVLDPKNPWYSAKVGPRVWKLLKARLTGRKMEDGTHYSSFVNLSEADADRLIENLKKDPRGYPQFNNTGGAKEYENLQKYQEWLVEEYLEKPFRQQVDEKIEERQIESRLREIQEAKKEIKEAETKEEVVAIIDDKVEVLEEIREQIAPPRSEYQIPDPWEGTYTTPAKQKPQATIKKTKKRGRPKGSKNKKKSTATPPNQPPEDKRGRVVNMMGGRILKTAKNFGKSLLSSSVAGPGGTAHYGASAGGGSTPSGAGGGPSILGIGSWIGKKITNAFQDAKEEKERALEAEAAGAELPPEVSEPGYFIKKSIGYQFGGRAFDTTFGAFLEKIPSKQSSSKSKFSDQFDYGDADPKKKKKKQSVPSELASGFRKVTKSLNNINNKLSETVQVMTKLVGETSRNSDLLQQILEALSGLSQAEMQTPEIVPVASQEPSEATQDQINNIFKVISGEGGGVDALDALGAVDDSLDIAKLLGKKKPGLGGQNKLYKNMRQRGMPSMKSTPRMGAPTGRFGMIRNVLGAGRAMLSEGGRVSQSVPAMIGEAGPELLIRNAPQKLAEGGVMQGAGSNILAGLGAANDLMKRVQPFANVLQLPLQVAGAQISNVLKNLVAAAGPFSGAIAKMFSPLLGGLATIFGLNQGAFAGELNAAAMTEKEGAKTLSKFFANFFKIFGINIGEDENIEGNENPDEETGHTGDYKELLDMIAGKESASAGGYIAYNEGGAANGYQVVGYGGPSDQGPLGRKLTDMTVAEIMQHQKDKSPPIHAAGRYQIIGSTMDGLINRKSYGETGVSPNDKFNAATQDKLGIALIKYRLKTGATVDNFVSEWRGLKFEKREKLQAAIDKANKAYKSQSQAAKGIVKPVSNSFSNAVQGVFEMSGPDTGYKVPEDLTGGKPVVGHGLEWLIKMTNKFIILPGVNKEYNVYKDPAKAFNRYVEIGKEAGVPQENFVNFIDRVIFRAETIQPPQQQLDVPSAAPQPQLPIIPPKPSPLPSPTIKQLDVSRATQPSGVAILNNVMIQERQVPVYIPVPVPGPVQYRDANPYEAAKKMHFMQYVKTLS